MNERVIYIKEFKRGKSVEILRKTLRETIELALKTEAISPTEWGEDIKAVDQALKDGNIEVLRTYTKKEGFSYAEAIRIYIAAIDGGQ